VDDLLMNAEFDPPQPRNRRERRAMAAGVLGYTVNEFCARFNISRSLFYKERREGRGPKTMKIGRRRLISPEAADEYRAGLEE